MFLTLFSNKEKNVEHLKEVAYITVFVQKEQPLMRIFRSCFTLLSYSNGMQKDYSKNNSKQVH